MFWRKKKIAAAPAEVATAGTGTAAMAGASAVKKEEKLPGPKPIPEFLGNHLIKKMGKEAAWVWRLSAVTRPRAGGEKGLNVRIFSEYEASDKMVKIKDYTTLDQNPKLILFEGWFDKEAKAVELEEKRVIPKVTIHTEKEIQAQVAALTEKGSRIYFYLSASPASGGPLGRGAALIELNQEYPAKGHKKYIVSAVSVDGTEPAGKGIRMFDTNDPKYVARWVKERHFKAA